MQLNELYKTNKPNISIELFPPKTSEGISRLFERVETLKQHQVSFFSMTYGAAGSTRDLTLELVKRLKNDAKVETMCHLTIVGQSQEEICQILDQLQEMEIYNIIALRGDPPKGLDQFKAHPNGFHHAVDLVKEIKRRKYFTIAVAGFPEIHPDSPNRQSDILHLKEKVDAGADVIITQLFFDNQYYFEYLDEIRSAGISVPVIPGILPIISSGQVRRFTNLCKSKIPLAVEKSLSKYENDDEAATAYGIELATLQCQNLLDAGVPGIHFYSLNRSHSVEHVLQNLAQK